MAFRLIKTSGNPVNPTPIGLSTQDTKVSVLPVKKKIYTQEDIDLIDEKFKEKEDDFKNNNPSIKEYTEKLVSTSTFQKEIIIFDQNIGKWKLIKE